MRVVIFFFKDGVGGGLRALDNPMNAYGLKNISVGYPEERTRLGGHPIYPATPRNLDLKYLRRCTRVPLAHESVNGFINNYCSIMGNEENYLDIGRRQEKVMEQMLVKQFLSWIRDSRAVCLDDSRWFCLRSWTISCQTSSQRFIGVLAGRRSTGAIVASKRLKNGWSVCKYL